MIQQTGRRVGRLLQRAARATLPKTPFSAPAFVDARLEHGAVGVWDEVALIAVGTIAVVAYGLWLYAVRKRE